MLNTPDSPNTPKLGLGSPSPSDSPADNNQDSYKDLGLAALVILAQFHGIAINAADIQHRYDVNCGFGSIGMDFGGARNWVEGQGVCTEVGSIAHGGLVCFGMA